MKNLIKSWMPILGVVILFSACSKTDIPVVKQSIDLKTELNALSIEQKQDLYNAFNVDDSKYKNGAEKMVPFMTNQGFGILKDLVFDENFNFVSGQIASINVATTSNDFIRKNTDGTYSVHYSSNAADMEYEDFGTGDYYSGSDGKAAINYTGELLDFGFFKFIAFGSQNNAVVIHGAGKVSDDDSEHTLIFKWQSNKNQNNTTFSLH